MTHFAPVALPHANRLINHGPTVLITSVFGGRRNVMAAAWSMPVEFSPPRVAVVIDKSTFTRELMTAHGGFGLCVPAGTPVVLSPREHVAFEWLPWREAADRCFSASNAEACLLLPRFV